MTSINTEVAAEGATFNQDLNGTLAIWRRRVVGRSGWFFLAAVFSSVQISCTKLHGHFDTAAFASALSAEGTLRWERSRRRLNAGNIYEAAATDACNEDKLPAAA